MKVAFLSPLPPTRSGIAHYSATLLPALRAHIDVAAFGSFDNYRRDDFDAVIYQLGNNPHHEFIYREAMANPGVAVLHDVVLHHLIVEMTLARGDVDSYIAALEANHGEAGAAWARGRAIGLHHEMANFLLPASIDLASRSRAVIVHNEYAASWLRSFGVETPIHVVPHPYVREPEHHDLHEVRRRLGFAPADRVIGFFGFLTAAKRAEVVLEAFAEARVRDSRLRLLIVGEAAPNIDVDSLRGEGVVLTGYVGDDAFNAYYAAADRVVNLRYPSAGETSGTLIRAFAMGKPVAVSDYAQFAEFPDACVVKIPFGDDEIGTLASFFLDDLDADAFARAQRQWLEQNAALDLAVAGYLAALGVTSEIFPAVSTIKVGGLTRGIALFPRLRVVSISAHDPRSRAVTIRNAGDITIAARLYGEPGYRIIAKLFDGPREIENRWIELPRDLPPGGDATILVPFRPRATLQLHHALESIPLLEPEAWYAAAL